MPIARSTGAKKARPAGGRAGSIVAIDAAGREAAEEARASLAQANRIVIKIGTNTIMRRKDSPGRLCGPESSRESPREGGIDIEYLHRASAQIAELARSGKQVIVVTSGAIGMGARELGIARRVTELRMRQACAAIGQIALMDEWRRAFSVFGLTPAQILVTRDEWDNRSAYLNLRTTIETLLEARAVPVFNENDVVSTLEIGNAFGDNDQLSAYIASKIDAELLLILSDVDALYEADPRENPGAKSIPYVRDLTEGILAAAGGKGSEFSTGGMATKLKAVAIARDAGCKVVIADGRETRVITRILAGEGVGTLFDASHGLKNRERWIKNSKAQGEITIDEGALAAIKAKRSLLPAGTIAVEGRFERGAVVLVRLARAKSGAAKLVTSLSSEELELVVGKKSEEVEALLGSEAPKLVARPEETVFLEE
jgi:glutamate 5-kinase